jgi:N-acyl-L-homoserine lactone synthetase
MSQRCPSWSSNHADIPFSLDNFEDLFEVVRATTPELVERAYQLRYQIFCIEEQRFDPREHPNGLEMDVFDAHSVHSLLIYRASQSVAGAVRLVLPVPAERGISLPIQQCGLYRALADPGVLTRAGMAEVSRFCIQKDFRGGALPYITLGLYRAILDMCANFGITHVCAYMKPSLVRLLTRFGFVFAEVGCLVNYHGWRQPVFWDLETALLGVWRRRPQAWAIMTDRGRLLPLPPEAKGVGTLLLRTSQSAVEAV